MLCVKAHLPTKQNADSQKKRVLSVSQKHHVLHKHLAKSCSCFALLSWLLLCWAARTCTLSPPMSCLCYTCLRHQNLFSCVHGPKSAPLSWLLLRFTACTCTLSLLCHVSALKVWETQLALAVVAGGTRQRRLNRYSHIAIDIDTDIGISICDMYIYREREIVEITDI